MGDVTHTDKKKIAEILEASQRMRFLLVDTYKVKLDEVTSIRVDSDNTKIDVHVGTRMLRFKAKGTENALVPDEAVGGVAMKFDPWLAQELHQLVEDFAG